MKKLTGINNVIKIPASLSSNFFRFWVEFLTPLHNLTNREKDVLAAFLKARFELSETVKDDILLDKIVLSDDSVKEKVRKECGVSNAFLQVILGKLKKTGIIQNNALNSKFIPKGLDSNSQSFQLLLYFDLNENN